MLDVTFPAAKMVGIFWLIVDSAAAFALEQLSIAYQNTRLRGTRDTCFLLRATTWHTQKSLLFFTPKGAISR